MFQASGVIICLGYILGLLFSAVPGGGFWVLGLSLVGAILFKRGRSVVRHINQTKEKGLSKSVAPQKVQIYPHPRVWFIAGLMGLLASYYLSYRVPVPTANDISLLVPPGNNSNQEQLFIVRGNVLSSPRLTRTSKGQFWMQAYQLDGVKNEDGKSDGGKSVSGKLYVTVPLLQATGLYPSQQIAVTGVLYKPKAAVNPGTFDFQKYLANEGVFAALSGRQLSIRNEERPWGWWKVREQIVRSQVSSLGVPEGPLVSAMVLGSKAVDLPYDTRDAFVQTGLAHGLAASGFQISLVLSIVLGLSQRAKRGTQFILGCLALLAFISLTGFQPAILRAAVMGFGALIALLLGRKVKQLGSLLVTATILLIVNPLWIWDLGFQLSFLATLGLIVTATALTKRLEWLPPAMASLISVPLAAIIWTLPLQLNIFGVAPTYSLLMNILSTPLISVISVGGFISAAAALIIPAAGSAIAGLLYYPANWLLRLVEFFSNFPGNSFAIGSITVTQMVVIYILLILTWLVRWWQQRWWVPTGIVFALIFVPAWHTTNNLFRVTMLAANDEPVIVIQDRGQVSVINSGDEGIGRFTILPFLQQQGVNQIHSAVSSDFQGNGSDGWLELIPRLPIKVFYDYSALTNNVLASTAIQKGLQNHQGAYQPLGVGQTINIGSSVIRLINDQLPILQLQIQGKNWLLVGNLKPSELQELIKQGGLPQVQVLWCPPQVLQELVPILQPEITITTNADLDPKILSEIGQTKTQLLFTGRDGAITWTPNGQFEAFIQTTENKSSLF